MPASVRFEVGAPALLNAGVAPSAPPPATSFGRPRWMTGIDQRASSSAMIAATSSTVVAASIRSSTSARLFTT